MMRLFYVFMILCFAHSINATNYNSDLDETVRILTGKMEELEKKIEEMQSKISLLEDSLNKKREEESVKKEIDAIANKPPEEVLKTACDMIDENNMEEARRLITAFISQNPTNIFCGMMLFNMGNSYFVEKDYKNAAIEYMKSFKANPKGSKAAESLYKLALCFKQLSEMEKCKSTLKKIIEDYSGHEIAKKASAELKKLK